eukprot:TRINITY_DN17144_c0_g1_i1.p1 TRINITY_DN17144_c0_g1~~TRINITY_DN17144_c0_g1_i1.p1  ORF type:complete len:643 (-),score=137.72 TRINITY_DN17144_c0_g1_i1:21-1949(-)
MDAAGRDLSNPSLREALLPVSAFGGTCASDAGIAQASERQLRWRCCKPRAAVAATAAVALAGVTAVAVANAVGWSARPPAQSLPVASSHLASSLRGAAAAAARLGDLGLKSAAAAAASAASAATTGKAAAVLGEVPDTSSGSGFSDWLWFCFTIVGVLTVVIVVLQYVLVAAAKALVERYDRDYLGVDVEIGRIFASVFRGRVEIRNLTVKNPEGYANEHLLKAEEFILNIGLRRTLGSLGREIEIQELLVRGIEVHVEFDGHIAGKSNVMTVVERAMESTYPKGEVQPVYDYWHASNGEHTFHMAPAWPGEERGHIQFFAYTRQVPGTEPVYDFYNPLRREHVFHMGPGRFGEKRGAIQFYAYNSQVQGTRPVHEFWHHGNREHTTHMPPAWDREEQGDVLFYAYADDPKPSASSKVKAFMDQKKPLIKPVYAFWHSRTGQHTFHFAPEWRGEKMGTVQFYAYDGPYPGTEPVHDFWNPKLGRKSFHLGAPRDGEEKLSILFYVFPKQVAGSEAVYAFRHKKNSETNIHRGDPWEGEVKGTLQFFAYPADPYEAKYFVRRVKLEEITASSSTKLANASVLVDDIRYGDFSWQYNATSADEIAKILAQDLLSKVSLRVGRGAVAGPMWSGEGTKRKKVACCF